MRIVFWTLVGSLLTVVTAHGQTLEQVARTSGCSTAGVVTLSNQLVETQTCLRPGQFVAFDDHPNIVLNTTRVHAFGQASARRALHAAASRGELRISSGFRTVAQQYVLYHSGACVAAALPGRSNHQSGRAVDLSNWSSARAALEGEGCVWLGSGDPYHFDCPGVDLRADSMLAFQHLWNLNHPDEPLPEDGIYGAATRSALARAPAGGFAITGCRGAVGCGVEGCNDRDDDCDGTIDEGLSCAGSCTPGAVSGAESELFKDLPAGQFGHEEAALLYRAGITTGCQRSPLLFCPRCVTSRAQMVTFVIRAMGVDHTLYASRNSFDDVAPSSTYHPYIEAAAALGVTTGCGTRRFCPDADVTRAQAATFIVRGIGWTTVPPTGAFEDVPDDVYRPNIETLHERCAAPGCDVRRFCPGGAVTRAQAAYFIAHAWNLEGINDCLSEVCNAVDDDLDERVDEGLLNACGTCERTVPEETCAAGDEDCDGRTDEGLTCDACPDGAERNACGTCAVLPADDCDDTDSDCDGTVDEDCVASRDAGAPVFDGGREPADAGRVTMDGGVTAFDGGGDPPEPPTDGELSGGCGCRALGAVDSRPQLVILMLFLAAAVVRGGRRKRS